MPDSNDVFDRMGGSQIFSTLDCASAYWSIPLREEDKECTAFVSTRGQYEFNRMPFGLCNSQATYQRAIDNILKEATNAEAFVDDIVVHSRDFELHLNHLDHTLRRLAKAGIQLRLDKCKFAYREVQFLGHRISGEGRQPLPDTLLRIEQYPRPGNKKDIRRFMGLINWYREYVPSVATLAEPLHHLTRKEVTWIWSTECETSFVSLKNLLTREFRILAFPRWEQAFYLETDASGTGIGAILSQMDAEGRRRPIQFYSAGLNQAQKKYAAGELEAWGIIAAVRKWRTYLRAARKVIILTDHNPLKWLRRQKDPRNKFARWILELESYDYQIEYRDGGRRMEVQIS